ncbi:MULTISPECIES: 50S ribosomal protein L30 [Paenibacillus]|jgi:large subunit ribosomal protein L30|uniref:Large ribosomal subunit protein uL30 n=4 Tax=Paenibacillus TaxID=44249 RepID=A0A1R0YRV3_9BACL|nr:MULTISPECIES: 50S ribosomal protein L30 [Paenibacillus]MBY3625254.1 50S ribosomal protein L30 [Acinetobacter sp. CUI P1]AIQ26234.1 50S ribosomal protein L30 [Paenibacillus sp. FSL H7-0737]AIQ38072.1 50S ribosomal protein L30 [Paenibacillus sp. FSL R5-0345]AIQ76690.1 50S ribosomal protein L30 [Paenibacillus odorifer]AWV35975.1 50S ribosomal protein L30 [Paenibacillus odorifer]
MAKLQITLVRSVIGRPETQRVTVKTLGLRKLNTTVVHNDSPAIRGMINKVSHLLSVTEIEG